MPFKASDLLSPKYGFWLLLALCSITFFVNLGKAPVYILDEAKNAQCAREMLQNHNWVIPTFNQQLRTDKPPLHYFFMSTAYATFGVNEFAARLFSAVCGLLVVMLTYRFASRFLDYSTGLLSGIILLCSWQFGLEMRMAVPDPYLILLMTVSLYSFYQFYTSYNQWQLFIFYACIGLAILSKGPVALLLTSIIATVFLLWQSDFKWCIIKRFKPWYGLLLIAAISLPWYIMVDKATQGAWTHDFFYTHNYRRFVGAKEKHGGLFLVTILFVIAGMLPFSVFIGQALFRAFKERINSAVTGFLLIVVLVVVLFFSLAQTRLPNYAMPCYPFLSVILASYLIPIINKSQSIRIYLWIILIISLAIPVVLYFVIRKEPVLHAANNVWQLFLFLPVFIIAAICWQFKEGKHATRISVFLTIAGFIITGWILNLYAYPKVYSLNPVLATLRLNPSPEPMVSYRMYNASYNFYLQQPVQRFEDPKSLMRYLDTHRNAKIVTREKYLHELDSLPFKVYYEGKDIFENHINYLLKYK